MVFLPKHLQHPYGRFDKKSCDFPDQGQGGRNNLHCFPPDGSPAHAAPLPLASDAAFLPEGEGFRNR